LRGARILFLARLQWRWCIAQTRINSASLAAAMRRLFDAGKIYNESHGRPSRQRFHLAIKA